MGSLGGGEAAKRRKAMWLYPKVVGFNPPERWGHSACFCEGVLYVFGGCCGGLHFNDVLTLNFENMSWSSLATMGQKPGNRDSHSAAIMGQRMVVFGGTNGMKKVNDLHILDLQTKEWSKPTCKGIPPTPRESHTTTLMGEDRLVVFGGSGEGEANYLNDVHVLDLKTMAWTSPEVKGDPPAPRDSHTAVAIGNKLLIYGGDCGDRYHGEVDVLDTDSMSWSRLMVQGSSPGVRAGHATVAIGTKVYIIGGVGDKQYYSDVWVLDVATSVWTQLDTRGQHPQGRFSHTAAVANSDIVIYGGCGEDECPLNELLILQLGSEHPNGRYNVSMCKIFGNHWSQEKKKFLRSENLQKVILKKGDSNRKLFEADAELKNGSVFRSPDNMRAKRRKVNHYQILDNESEQEEHSLSLSQHSSPSQSDQEQNTAHKLSSGDKGHQMLPSQPNFGHFKWKDRACQEVPAVGREAVRQPKTEQFLRAAAPPKREMQFSTSDQKSPPPMRLGIPPLFGAEVRGTVDGAFDSGYLMTANVKGQIFRGVLFAPGPSLAAPRQMTHCQSTVAARQQSSASAQVPPINVVPPPQAGFLQGARHPIQAAKSLSGRPSTDLHGVVLTLGGPGDCAHSGS